MQVTLIAAAQAEAAHFDANTMPLTAAGREQAQRLAAFCAEQGAQFLCASAMARAQQTADAIHARLPDLIRWDLEELEELSMEDLLYNPAVGPLVSTWTTEQRVAGLERVWVRLMAVWARVQLYAQNNGLERVVIVGHRYTTLLFLLHFLGLDWSAYPALDLAVEPGSVSQVTLDDAGAVRIETINRGVGGWGVGGRGSGGRGRGSRMPTENADDSGYIRAHPRSSVSPDPRPPPPDP